jgi:hypothetical protein
MELALICAQQVIVLFLLIGAGAAAIKTGVLKPEGRQTLSNLLVYLVVPAMIVHSYMMDFSEEILHNLLAAFGLSVLAILIGTVLTLALTARQKDRRAPIFRFASVFSNAAYMGFPLISVLFGSEGLLYASAYVTVFNILLWTMGYGMVSGSSSLKEVTRSLLRTPVLYAMVVGLAVYLLQIPVPALIAPAAGTAEQHEHPAFHAHHRHPHRHGRPEADRLRPAHLETGRAADAGHPGSVSGGLCGAGSAALRHERTGGAAVGVLPCRCDHLGVRRSVRPR